MKLNQAVSERLTQLLNEKGMTQYQLCGHSLFDLVRRNGDWRRLSGPE